MSHHDHHAACLHGDLKYCRHCNVVFCRACSQEWRQQATYYTWQYQTTPYYPATPLGGSLGVTATNAAACAHDD